MGRSTMRTVPFFLATTGLEDAAVMLVVEVEDMAQGGLGHFGP
jgi:hypothetical protein